MTDAINTNNRVKLPNSGTQPTAPEGGSRKTGGATESASKAPASTVVDLSSERLLEQVEQVPEVNQGRVDQIKAALAKGEYQADPQVIASKFAEIEKLLP